MLAQSMPLDTSFPHSYTCIIVFEVLSLNHFLLHSTLKIHTHKYLCWLEWKVSINLGSIDIYIKYIFDTFQIFDSFLTLH